MKLALISDLHLGARNDSAFFLDNFLKFSRETFFPYLQNNDIKTVLLLGDIWDRRKYINFNTLYRALKEFFDTLQSLEINVKIIYGNHDVFFKNTNIVNGIDLLLKPYQNIEIVEFAKIFNFDGLNLGMIGWIHAGNLKESIDWIQSANIDVLCGHFEIKNFEMIPGHFCEQGFDPEMFSRFEYVFSGHFHVISSNTNNIYYLGNPQQLNWSDFGLKKGFHIFDTNTRELELIENPHHVYEKLQYDDEIDILDFDYQYYSDKIVRVYVDSLSLNSRRKFDLFIDKLTQISYDVSVQEIDRTMAQLFSEGIVETKFTDTIEYIKTYIDSVDSSTTIDKNVLKIYFNDIYSEAVEKSTLQ